MTVKDPAEFRTITPAKKPTTPRAMKKDELRAAVRAGKISREEAGAELLRRLLAE